MTTTKITPAPLQRPLHEVAAEIASDWGDKLTKLGPETGFGPAQHPARPYWEAMRTLHTLDSSYYLDPGTEIVRRFLSNASQWRGETAQRVKLELKAALADHDEKRRWKPVPADFHLPEKRRGAL
jgi:hypothetical protein